ncbi:MAG: SWIM zinc finger family protein [Methanobacteriota archaeon]
MSWEYYPKSTPRAVKDGIKVKSKRGDIGEQWWSKRFLDALNRMGMDSRLARGRNYARRGQVSRLEITDGVAYASVQGSKPRPYQVEIKLKPWDKKTWSTVIAEIAGQALYAAELLAGEMPHEIEEVVQAAGVKLFPDKSRDLDTDCDCPDYANPCKHIAAAYYILAERFDTDPFLIFAMRGKGKEELLDELRKERGAAEPEIIPAQVPKLATGQEAPVPLTATGFYDLRRSLDDFEVHLTAGPEVKGAILRRLGPSPFIIGKMNFCDLISPVYEFGPEYVRRSIHGEKDDQSERGGG